MALSKSSLGTVLDRLLAKTVNGDLVWSDSGEPTEYKTGTAKFWYYIKTRDEDGVGPYRFQVYKRATEPIKLAEEFSIDHDEAFVRKFATLHEQAFRSAVGLSRELSEEILSDLDQDDSF